VAPKNFSRSTTRSLAFSLLLFLSLAPFALSQRRPVPRTNPNDHGKRPRLVLIIVVDQFRYEYLDRFGDLFGTNGIRRLLRDGASWSDANYDHVPTATAPGHSTISTGAYPSLTGIVANEWPDRTTGKKVTSVSDDSVKLFDGGPKEATASPRRLLASTIGDELRLATNDRSKVIGISVKARSAILPAGCHANAAYWLSMETGKMVSSSYYFKEMPSWVTAFNKTNPADKYFNAKWDRLLPEAIYRQRVGSDSPVWEVVPPAKADTNAFPHTINGGVSAPGEKFYTAIDYSPFSNEVILSFSESAIAGEQLGGDDDTDFLSVSFSSNDYVGHRYGPYSQEVMDITLRVDQQIGELLDFIDRRVGLKNTLIAFTADHGVGMIPEHAQALGLQAGRIKTADLLAAIRAGISAKYNPKQLAPDPTADYIYKYNDNGVMKDGLINGNLYFDRKSLTRDSVSLDEIEEVAGQAAMTVPGVGRFFTRAQLERAQVALDDPIARRVLHGFFSERSGDLILVSKPFYYLPTSDLVTHFSPYTYDTHVPLIMMGGGIVAGRYFQPATPADIAPTLAAVLHIQTPSDSVGRILLEAISK